jgi:hypothetical protein
MEMTPRSPTDWRADALLRTTRLQEMTRMNASQRTTPTPPPAGPSEEPPRERDEARERRRERERRISAAQLAAPSTRRWRRSGTFSPTE